MKTIFICTLEGNHVFHNQTFEGCITDFKQIDKVRENIKATHGLEFETHSTKGGWLQMWEFDNITDDRDIKLRVYKSELIP